ncbi:MAG: hydrogenase maturation protease [Gammaproteobacteria bacterium]|nr:hydrogenase maturation protease [Gammaproteobacteria bacterium]MDH4255663.1 hydrogenase maturation protease [Gammaproteobacteria bacterium]
MSAIDPVPARRILVLGVGNTLLRDDGLGVHVASHLRTREDIACRVTIVDGGTLGLSLLPEIEDSAGLIVIDAAELGEPPGAVRVFEERAMDQQLSGRKRSVHEVAVADLLAAATLTGQPPAARALVAIQPDSTDWGLEPTAAARASIEAAADAVSEIIERWHA